MNDQKCPVCGKPILQLIATKIPANSDNRRVTVFHFEDDSKTEVSACEYYRMADGHIDKIRERRNV